jgi:adenylate cyclase
MIATEKVSTREIERKFLVKRLPVADLENFPRDEIAQGYLAIESGGVQVRLRKKGNVRSLTYKRNLKNGREEREIRISAEQFEALWPATAGRRLTKVRYEMPWKGHTIEIDVYTGRHDGLVVAEVEFADEKSCTAFKPPDWMDEDVTGKARYSNVLLAHD